MTATTHTTVEITTGPQRHLRPDPGDIGAPLALRGLKQVFLSRWEWEAQYVRLLVVVDLVAATGATTAAFAVRFRGAHWASEYLLLSAMIPVVWLAVLALTRAYEPRQLFVGPDEYQRTIRAGLRLTVGMALASYVFNASLARGYLLLVLVGTTTFSLLGRLLLRRLLQRARRRGLYLRRVLIVGHAGAVADAIRQLHRKRFHGLRVVGACLPADQLLRASDVLRVPVYGALGEAAASVAAARADTVVVLACPELDGAMLRRLAWELERDDIDLIVSTSLVDITGDRITLRPVDGLPMMHIEHPCLTGGRRLLKSVFDVFLSGLLLTLLAPVFLAVAVVVKLDSPGPVFFRQRRVGRDAREFEMIKFRTMAVDAERRLDSVRRLDQAAGVLFKIRRDPRVTRVGRLLRRYSLDELPQLINVLVGDMSLVGPRPPLSQEVARYPKDMRRRLVVKPGITGLWQVSGRSDLPWDEAIRLDLRYVENWSFTADLVILVRTALAVVRGAGAY